VLHAVLICSAFKLGEKIQIVLEFLTLTHPVKGVNCSLTSLRRVGPVEPGVHSRQELFIMVLTICHRKKY